MPERLERFDLKGSASAIGRSGTRVLRELRPSLRGVACIGAMTGAIAAFVVLELRLQYQRLASTVRTGTSADGTVFSAQFGAKVTREQWHFVVASHPDIKALTFNRTITLEGGLEPLAKFPELREIEALSAHAFDDVTMASLHRAPKLQRLIFDGVDVSDLAMASLSRLPSVRNLAVRNSPRVTDEAIDCIMAMPRLHRVDLTGTAITFTGFTRLRRARPRVLIRYEPDPSYPKVTRLTTHATAHDPLRDASAGPGLIDVYAMSFAGSVEKLQQFLGVQHDWVTGESSSLWLDRVTELKLDGPGAEQALCVVTGLLPHVSRQGPADSGPHPLASRSRLVCRTRTGFADGPSGAPRSIATR